MELFRGYLQDTPVNPIVTKEGNSTEVHIIEESRVYPIMCVSELTLMEYLSLIHI